MINFPCKYKLDPDFISIYNFLGKQFKYLGLFLKDYTPGNFSFLRN